jgi:membrane protease YdiL (CAAX protease family)
VLETGARTVIVLLFLVVALVARGPNPGRSPTRRPWRELGELATLIAAMLAVPLVRFRLGWYSGWVSPYFVLCLLAPLVLELLLRRRPLSAVGLREPQGRRVTAMAAVLAAFYLLARVTAAMRRGGPLQVSAYGLISATLVFPFLEEMLFRGLIQTRLEALAGPRWAWMASGLLFGFYYLYVHYLTQGRVPTPEEALGLAYLTALGWLLGAMRAKTGSLWPGWWVHAANNLGL